jgi:dTDP-4-dehydrorhamnose 3,5-epimerase
MKMGLEIKESEKIKDLIIVEPQSFGDQRGVFTEVYRRSWLSLGREMIQVNKSKKVKNSLVGLHYHLHQADYWFVVHGSLNAVLYDFRQGSPTQGELVSIELSDENNRAIFIPPGIAHGFLSKSDMTMVYLVDGYYNPSDELGIAWDDENIKEIWQAKDPIISERDLTNPRLKDIPMEKRPVYPGRT